MAGKRKGSKKGSKKGGGYNKSTSYRSSRGASGMTTPGKYSKMMQVC